MKTKIQMVAFVCDQDNYTYWHQRLINFTSSQNNLKIHLVNSCKYRVQEQDQSSLGWKLYHKLFLSNKSRWLKSTGCPQLRTDCPWKKVDLVVNLSRFKVQIPEKIRLGIWSFSQGNINFSQTALEFAGDFINRKNTQEHFIYAEMGGGLRDVLMKFKIQNHLHSYVESVDNTLDRLLEGYCSLLRDYLSNGNNALDNLHSFQKRSLITFSFLTLFKLILQQFKCYLKKIYLSEFVDERWGIAYGNIPANISLFDCLQSGTLPPVTWLSTPEKFLADPFILESNEKVSIYVEEIPSHGSKGILTSFTIEDSKLTKKQQILKLPHHLSYPFIVNSGKEQYFLPECANSNNLKLFKLDEVKQRLVPTSVIMSNVQILDPSIIFYKSKWWLFATLLNDRGMENLHLWYSDHLESGWTPHKLNPVKRDISASRPGGALFVRDGFIYRFAQNCELSYGGSLKLMKITSIDENSFKEEECAHFMPEKKSLFPDGVHSLNFSENFFVIDGKKMVFSPLKCIKWISARLVPV